MLVSVDWIVRLVVCHCDGLAFFTAAGVELSDSFL